MSSVFHPKYKQNTQQPEYARRGIHHARKRTQMPLRTSRFWLVQRWWPGSKPVTCTSRDRGEYACRLESRDNSCKQSLGGSVNKHSCRHQ